MIELCESFILCTIIHYFDICILYAIIFVCLFRVSRHYRISLKYSEGLEFEILYGNVEAIIVFKLVAIKVH